MSAIGQLIILIIRIISGEKLEKSSQASILFFLSLGPTVACDILHISYYSIPIESFNYFYIILSLIGFCLLSIFILFTFIFLFFKMPYALAILFGLSSWIIVFILPFYVFSKN